jgi:hypothetical protein
MYRSNTTRRVGIVVLFTFMLSGGALGAWFNLFDLATCTARGGEIAVRNDPGDT